MDILICCGDHERDHPDLLPRASSRELSARVNNSADAKFVKKHLNSTDHKTNLKPVVEKAKKADNKSNFNATSTTQELRSVPMGVYVWIKPARFGDCSNHVLDFGYLHRS